MTALRNPTGLCPRCGWLSPVSDYLMVEGRLERWPGLHMTVPGVCPACGLNITEWDADRRRGYGRERALAVPPARKQKLKLRIMQDETPENPRDDRYADPLGTWYTWSSHYVIGGPGDQRMSRSAYSEPQEWLDAYEPDFDSDTVIVDIVQYFPEGIGAESHVTGEVSRHCIGFAVMTPDEWRKAGFVNAAQAELAMRGDIQVYDRWSRGEVWGYIITVDEPIEDGGDDLVDSCWGFIGETLEETGLADYLSDRFTPSEIENAWDKRYDR